MAPKAKEAGVVPFNAERRARYDLYTVADTLDLVRKMRGYLEKSGEVLAKQDYTNEATKLKSYETILKTKKDEKLKQYYVDYS